MPPPSQFKPTPASRVFGFGLPVNRSANRGVQYTFRGMPLAGDLQYFNPLVQQQAREERRLALEEQQLALQQRELERHQRAMDAEEALLAGVESGEEIGNVFQKNPAIALSRNFNQFANMAEMAKPSKAMQSVIPSLAMKLPIEERIVFNQLVSTPEFANNPFAAYDEAQLRGARSKQHGELVKNMVPLAKIDPNRDYSAVEFQDLINQHKKSETGTDFTDNLVKQAWSGFDEQYVPPEGVTDPVAIALDIADKKNSIREGIMRKYGGKPAIPTGATAQNITSPAAMGGAIPLPSASATQAPQKRTLSEELTRIPATEQAAFLERKKAEEEESAKVGREWNNARLDLEQKLKKLFPDKPFPGTDVVPLEQLALQIKNGVMVPSGREDSETGAPINMNIGSKVLSDLGLYGGKTAFKEPGRGRKTLGIFGSQDVTYEELIKDWADQYLNQRGKLLPSSQSPTGSNLTEQQQKDMNDLMSLVRAK